MPLVILAQTVIFRSVPPRAPTTSTSPKPTTLLVPAGVAVFLISGAGIVGWIGLLTSVALTRIPFLGNVSPPVAMSAVASCVGGTAIAGALGLAAVAAHRPSPASEVA